MGLFSSIFKGIGKGVSFVGAYREASGQSYDGGGYGYDRFCSVIDAHSSVEDMVEDLGLAEENCPYQSVDGYDNPWTQAYEECLEAAESLLDFLEELYDAMDEICPYTNAEELIDYDLVEIKAWGYACNLAEAWLDGSEWIPSDVMDYAWYELSDHNG